MRKSLFDRFIEKVNIPADPNECWEWTSRVGSKGYGEFKLLRKTTKAHRVSFELFNGIALSNFVLHSCDNRSCVNPAHLREGTQSENIQDSIARNRQWQVRKTHCAKGHAYDFSNTYLKKRGGSFKRECRACARDRERAKRKLLTLKS